MPQRKRILVADDQGANRKLTMHRLEQLGFDVDVVENDRAELIAIFLDDAPNHMRALRDALANRDAASVAESAHALKSGSGNVGATRVYELCDAMEMVAGRGDVSAAADLFSELENELLNWRP